MNTFGLVVMLMSVMSMSGCGAVGNGKIKGLTERSASEVLVPGTTTRHQVEQALGKGEALQFESGCEIWVYRFSSGLPQAVNYIPIVGVLTSQVHRAGKELRILFDRQGVVQKYLLLDSIPASGKASY